MGEDLGFVFIVLLTFFFVFTYLLGRRENFKRQKNLWKKISVAIKPYCKKVNFKGLGSSAFQISLRRSRLPFKKFELIVSLLDRENILHYFLLKLMKKTDELIVKADFEIKPGFELEVYKGKRRVKEGMFFVKSSILPSGFRILTSNKDKAENFFVKIGKKLSKCVNEIVYLSISPVSPTLIFTVSLDGNTVEKVMPVILELGETFKMH